MKPQPYTPGDLVWTQTTSGEPILCTVIARELTDAWLLASPAHGYAIVRATREMQKMKKENSMS